MAITNDTLPDSRYVPYEGAGHNYLVAAGKAANAEVLAFLEGVAAAQAAQA